MSLSEEAKQKACHEHYVRFLKVEFERDLENLSDIPPLEGPPIPITSGMVNEYFFNMKSGKTSIPSG